MKSNDLNLTGLKRIGIMGGTFDPIHLGHLVAAEAARYNFNLEKVIFIPTGKPPHKEKENICSDEHRYMMTTLATLDNPYFETSSMEIDRPGVSYTVDTLNEFHRLCDPDVKIYFIVGADALCDMVGWKNARELFSLAQYIALPRPGHNLKKLKSSINDIYEFYGAHIHFLDIPAISISSTEIRNRISSGNTVKYLLKDEVERYIYKYGLYSVNTPQPDEICKRVRGMLSEKRYNHTMGVAEETVKLAEEYGLSKNKLYIAGLLHDCAKEISQTEMEALIKKHKIKLDSFTKKSNELVHGIVGSVIAKYDFKINDEDILNAIKFHTTGRKEMTSFEKVIFLADIIEPGRDPYNELNEIRQAAHENLDRAVFLGMKMKIRYLSEKNRKVHPFTMEAFEYYKKINKIINGGNI